MVWTWAAIAAAAVVAVLTSVAAVAVWQRPRKASGPGEVEQLLADAEAVRAAAERAAEAAEEARREAERAAGARDRAEDRYLEARWEARVATADEAHLLVQRAALAAYRRGELSVEQLNGIWHHAGPPAEQLDDGRVRDARRAYEEAVADTVQSREQVHVASVAAEVLVEEAHNAEVDVLEAWEAREAARPTLDKLFQEENA
ncbi:hypothetical protein [Actinoplanes xinjiangensis]|uniref:hypothetical protein n=1 Tax=Actinoplanes xinjiangensis TaxID=512350 RepID=UPI003414CA36